MHTLTVCKEHAAILADCVELLAHGCSCQSFKMVMTFSHCVTCRFQLKPIRYRDGLVKQKGFNKREDIIVMSD